MTKLNKLQGRLDVQNNRLTRLNNNEVNLNSKLDVLKKKQTNVKNKISSLKNKIQQLSSNNKSIVELAQDTPNLSTLVSALQKADLVSTLSGTGPFTVFVPTNDAFGKLPSDTLPNLLKTEKKEELSNILTYHVVPGKVLSSDLKDKQTIQTVNGDNVNVTLKDNCVYINDAKVTTADVGASNGVVHIIDSVLLPPS
jgi:uncharacterized surface protein with fasciclin (FAS1) repeats